MADANALYKRYMRGCGEPESRFEPLVLAACIIAEAIKNEEEIELKYIASRDNGK